MAWKLLPTLSAPMPLQMALDEILFEAQKKELKDPMLRFYVSSGPWISAGCSFRNSAALSKSELIRKNPRVPICRRVTGGGCVLHGRDLIFSLVAPYEAPTPGVELGGSEIKHRVLTGGANPLSSVRTSYSKIHEGVRMGFRAWGLNPKFYSQEEKLSKGNDCFDFPVESDLAWKGKKIAGGAQKRSRGVLLHHESISIPKGIERDELIQEVRQGMEEVFGVTIENIDLDPEIYFQAERKTNRLKTEDYRLKQKL